MGIVDFGFFWGDLRLRAPLETLRIFFDFKVEFEEGISRRQYEKLRIPMSILKMRSDWESAVVDAEVVPGDRIMYGSSSCRRWMRIGLVPEIEMPHLKAIFLSAVALSVLGMLIAIHDRLCRSMQ